MTDIEKKHIAAHVASSYIVLLKDGMVEKIMEQMRMKGFPSDARFVLVRIITEHANNAPIDEKNDIYRYAQAALIDLYGIKC